MPEDERATLRWLGLGALASLVACAGGFPGSRELLIANLGFSPILAAVLRHGFGRGPFAIARRAGAWFLGLMHVGLGPIGQIENEGAMRAMAARTLAMAHALTRETSARVSGRAFFVAGSSDPMITLYVPAILASETSEPLGCWSWLSGAPHADVTLTRTGRRSFELETRGTTLLRGAFESLFRAPSHPLSAGDAVFACGVRVRVGAVDDGRPTRIEIASDTDLDDAATAWLVWQEGALRSVAFPPVSESTTIAWKPGPSGMF